MSHKRRALLALIAAVVVLTGATFVGPANAADVAVMPQRLIDQLSNCQDDLSAATTAHAQAWAQDCVTAARAAIAAWKKANPVPTGVPTTAPGSPSPTTVPPTPTPSPSPSGVPTGVPPTTVPPTATPTPTPTPTPPGVASFATGPAGGAGAPAGTIFKPLSGVPQSGATYDAYAIGGGTINASNIVLRNCTLGEVVFTGDNITVDHCTIHGGVSFSQNHQVVFNHNNLTGWSDCIHITEDGQNGVPAGLADHFTVTGNWCHNPGLKAPDDCADHADGVQLLGVDTAVFSDNIIDLGPWVSCGSDPGDGPLNGAFQIENTQGPVLNVTIDGNLLDGGGYTFRAYAGTKLIAVTNNGFGSKEQFGPVTTLQATIGTWSGNYVVATGAAVPRG